MEVLREVWRVTERRDGAVAGVEYVTDAWVPTWYEGERGDLFYAPLSVDIKRIQRFALPFGPATDHLEQKRRLPGLCAPRPSRPKRPTLTAPVPRHPVPATEHAADQLAALTIRGERASTAERRAHEYVMSFERDGDSVAVNFAGRTADKVAVRRVVLTLHREPKAWIGWFHGSAMVVYPNEFVAKNALAAHFIDSITERPESESWAVIDEMTFSMDIPFESRKGGATAAHVSADGTLPAARDWAERDPDEHVQFDRWSAPKQAEQPSKLTTDVEKLARAIERITPSQHEWLYNRLVADHGAEVAGPAWAAAYTLWMRNWKPVGSL